MTFLWIIRRYSRNLCSCDRPTKDKTGVRNTTMQNVKMREQSVIIVNNSRKEFYSKKC